MSRRHDDMMTRGDRRTEMESDQYAIFDREERSWRNTSPSRFDRSERATEVRGRRSISINGRDYDWRLGGHSRVRSRSPTYEEVRTREIFYGEGINRNRSLSPPLSFRRRHELNEENMYSRGRDFHGYDNLASNVSEDKDVGGGRLSGSSRSSMLAQKSMAVEDNSTGGMFGLSQSHDIGPSSSYRDSGGYLPSLPGTSSAGGRIQKESPYYRGHLQRDKSSDIHSREGEKPIYYSRDDSFPVVPASQFSNFGSTSSCRTNISASYLDSRHLPADDFVRKSPKLSEPLKFDAYGQKPLPDSMRDLGVNSKDRLYQQQEPLSPNIQRPDHTYSSFRRREYDDYRDLSSEAYRNTSSQAQNEYRHMNMSLHPRLKHDGRDRFAQPREDYEQRDMPLHTQSDYNHTEVPLHTRLDHDTSHSRVDHYSKDSSGAGIMESPTSYYLERSHGNFTRNSFRTYSSSRDRTFLEGPDMVRVVHSSKEANEHQAYQNDHLEARRNVSRELEMDHPMLHLESEYNHERSARAAEIHRGRLGVQFASELDEEIDRHALRSQMWEANNLRIKHRSNRLFKRDYSVEDDVGRYSSRSAVPHQEYRMDLDDSGDSWLNKDPNELQFPETEGSNHNKYRRPNRMFHGRTDHTDISQGKFLVDRGPSEHVRRNFDRFHKPSPRYIKGITAPGSLRLSRHYRYNKRSDFQRHSNVWKRINDDQHLEEPLEDADTLEDCDLSSNPEPVEDTEEFKQLVTKAFWKFSKKLNENSGVRRRYTEQGKAGTLFCVVCSKSLSKEFKDTRRLAMHAFMTHKMRLSAQHLGLLKAICVMMGWNSDVDHKAGNWTPKVLTQSEALAQKEDLMLWPPVLIIHNVNISSNNPNCQKAVKEEELEVFLRGKGSMKGKIKVCLGNPANYSIMVVKFVGTFLGLQDVERLHKYFADNSHGRIDLEQLASKNSKRVEADLPEGKVNEQALYGFIGIADDLDKLDFDTKRKSLIQSKRGLQDFADEPVKPGKG